MQDNIGRTGSNWGKTPRTLRDAFPQYPEGSTYEEPTVAQKISDVIVFVGVIGVMGVIALWGGVFFGVI